ncbi:unnamed protein product [Periconia digitata]|uniref:Uncharacterized protein n=1 Tax=Periconia digitata TaxID=1303443 RepID=A0A9W4U2Q8_9PLEO|nr:unnamed protein product [Periconia digitata]
MPEKRCQILLPPSRPIVLKRCFAMLHAILPVFRASDFEEFVGRRWSKNRHVDFLSYSGNTLCSIGSDGLCHVQILSTRSLFEPH